MTKAKAFVSRIIAERGLELIRESCDAEVWARTLPPGRQDLMVRLRDIEGLLVLLTDSVDSDLITSAPGLRVISNMAAGVDNIDVPAASARRIPVGNTPDVLTDATADMTLALMLSAARRIPEGQRYVREGRWRTWEPRLLLGADLVGATLGIVGFGRIGQAVARRANGFGLRLLFHDPDATPAYGATPAELEVIWHESDFITLHVPLTAQTRHLINAETLAEMKSTAVLVNTSRGAVVDHSALHEALTTSRLAGAALDVTDPEPMPPGHPLLRLDNCVVVPHIASASHRARERMAVLAAQNLIAGLKGERLPSCVNPEVYTA